MNRYSKITRAEHSICGGGGGQSEVSKSFCFCSSCQQQNLEAAAVY